VCSNSNLEGEWRNQLGSYLELTCENNILTGYYVSPNVGDAGNTSYPLYGTYTDDTVNSTFGFSVSWFSSQSDTVWAGHLMPTGNGSYILRTSWLLVDSTSWVDAWDATTLGQDTFFRPDGSIGINPPPVENSSAETDDDQYGVLYFVISLLVVLLGVVSLVAFGLAFILYKKIKLQNETKHLVTYDQ
jgi:hypothetical protein